MVVRECVAASLIALAAPACCVAARSRVRTAAGERAAGELKVGDRVLSVDITAGRLVEREIVLVRRAVRECLGLRYGDCTLVCTPDHPLYAPDLDTWRPASDWVTGGARHLLTYIDASPEVVEVAAVETFAGVHEVVDITLDAEPRNFIAEGIVVHNKTVAVPHEDVEYLTADEAGPTFTLQMPGDARRFRVRICLDDADFSRGEFDVLAETSTSAKLAPGEALWLSLDSTAEPQEPVADTVPGSFFGFHEAIPDDACSAGFLVTFEHLQGPQDAEIMVSWDVSASTDHDIETPGMSLVVSITPED